MSNVFEKGTFFFIVPKALVKSGLLGDLSAGALKLYALLLFIAQEQTRVELELSNEEILKRAKLSPNTIRRARTNLGECGLIDLRHTAGGRYTYVILNPETRLPLPPPRWRAKIPSMTDAPSVAPSWSDIEK